VAHAAGGPVDLDGVAALHRGQDAGAGDERKAHADLAAEEARREGLGHHAGDAQVAHRAHGRVVRVAVAEVAPAHQQVAALHGGAKPGSRSAMASAASSFTSVILMLRTPMMRSMS
jgi:hypothetical protein